MKKYALILILFLLLGSLAALPAAYTSHGNPKLFRQLKAKAEGNLKTLPTALRKPYRKLLKDHSDILMAYFLAYESDANLAAATPGIVLSNYQEVAKLLDKERFDFTPEFFLSYIAKQSVSDEAITPYRQALLDDGLQEIIDKHPDQLSRFRATTLWCVSRLQFQQTSGRDQSPLDITQRSLIGRCEEMQILFVAAARTVGLPSRPATAPWWAHMDNNHAWAEVFLDGAWHYTGDMDAAWFPDQTWFSGMIDKTVLILADGSLAAESDEILSTGTYDTLINSTRNYAQDRTRLLKISVKTPDGKPAVQATVIPMVFNWGSLRALTYLSTDKNGFLQFSCGRGAFYLSVAQSGLQALRLVPSSEAKEISLEITLSAVLPGAESSILSYPGNPMTWDTQPEEYQQAVRAEKQRWTDLSSDFQTLADQQLAAGLDSLAYQVGHACRGNWPAFHEFLKQHPDPDSAFYEYLLMSDPKYLWQASGDQFSALYSFYLSHRQDFNGSEQDLNLLSPTVHYEDLPQPFIDRQGQPLLYPQEFSVKGASTEAKVQNAIRLLHRRHKIKPTKAMSGIPPLHLAVHQKYLNHYQFRIMACNILRANGIPAEFSRLPGLITIYTNGTWEYYDVLSRQWVDRDADSEGQEVVLNLKLQDENGVPIQASEEQLNLCRYVDGTFYSLVHRFEYLGDGWHRASFRAQDAYLHFGYRISDSATGFHQIPITASGKDSLSIEITAGQYPRTWLEADPQILALLDEEILNHQELILIGNYDQENSRRVADKLLASQRNFLWLGHQTSALSPENYQILPTWAAAVQRDSRNAMRCITLHKVNGAWQMFEGLWNQLP